MFFLFTCLLEVPRGLCMGTKRRKPGWALAEAVPREVVKVWNVQGLREEEEEEEDEQHVDEGLALWTEEYPELCKSPEQGRGSWPWKSLFTSLSASQKLSSSLDMARQCSRLSPASLSRSSLMDIMEPIGNSKSTAYYAA